MSCELCKENNNSIYGEWSSQMWFENDNELWFGSSGFAHGCMKVKYCPMCGRKLNDEERHDNWI